MEKLLNSSALKKNFNQHLILKFVDFFHTPFFIYFYCSSYLLGVTIMIGFYNYYG